jgi:hypothetical protein
MSSIMLHSVTYSVHAILSPTHPRLLSESLMYADSDNMYTRVATRAELQLHVIATRVRHFDAGKIGYAVCPFWLVEALLRVGVIARRRAKNIGMWHS